MTALSGIDPPQRRHHPRSRCVVDCAGAQLSVHELNSGIALRLDGEIDAANANLVAQAICGFLRLKAPLVLDVSHLDFLSVAGFRMLVALDRENRRADLHFCVVTGAALRRLMHIFTHTGLPVVDSVPEPFSYLPATTATDRRAGGQ